MTSIHLRNHQVSRFSLSLGRDNEPVGILPQPLRLREVNPVFDSVALAFVWVELKLHVTHYIPSLYQIAMP